MKQPIRPRTLKALRESRGLSQASLAAHSESVRQKVGLATIKRIEKSKSEIYMARRTVAERLAKTLRVDVKDLAKEDLVEDDRARTLRKIKLRDLHTLVPESTALGFRMVEHLYDIPIPAQVQMAPLFMALLAEGSLAWRKEKLAEIREKTEELTGLGDGNFSFTVAASRVKDAAYTEEKSINDRDLFGKNVDEDAYIFGYDPSENNPFADYLRELRQDLNESLVTLDPTHCWIEPSGFPEYRIGSELLEELTAGDSDAEYALSCGHARIAKIPEELLGEENTEQRVEWLIAQIPADEIADRKKWHEEKKAMFAGISLNFGDNSPSPNETQDETKENKNA